MNGQVVPEVIQALVDDGLVDTDKIGGGNFYWAVRRLVQSCVQSAALAQTELRSPNMTLKAAK